jgi:hypothetical protein
MCKKFYSKQFQKIKCIIKKKQKPKTDSFFTPKKQKKKAKSEKELIKKKLPK